MIDAAKIWFGKIKAKRQEWNTKGEGKKNEVLAVDGVPQINSIDNNLKARERISMNDEWFFIDPKNMEGNGPFTKEQIRQKLSAREVSFTDKLRNSENGSELEVSALMSLDGADAIPGEGKLNEYKRKKGPGKSLIIKMGLAVVICLGLWLLVVFFITESLGSKNVNIPEQYAEYGSLKPEAKVKRLISQHYDWTNKTKLKVVVGDFKSDADEPNRMDGYLTCSKDGWSAKVSIKARLRDDGKAAQWTLNRAQLMEAFDAIFDDDKLSAINAFDKEDLVEMKKICDKKKR